MSPESPLTAASAPRRFPIVGRRRVALAAVIAGLAILAGAALYTSHQARKKRDAAWRALNAGEYAACMHAVDEWLHSSPRSAEAYYVGARAALASGHGDELRASLVRAQELGYSEQRMAVLKALVAAQLGQYADAEPVLRAAFEENNGADSQVDESLSRLYLQSYDFERALPVLERWARVAPRNPRPYLWLCEVDQRLERRASSLIDDYKAALERDPEQPKARLGLAKELRAAHRNAEAKREFAQYLRLRPNDVDGYVEAAMNALELQDQSSALRWLDHAIQLDPKRADAYRARAELALLRGDAATALPFLDRAVDLDPFDHATRYKRAQVLARVGRHKESAAEQAAGRRLQERYNRVNKVRELLVINPHDRALQCEMAQWMFEHGHEDEGRRWCEKIVKEEPGHPRASQLLADYYERQGKHGLANYHRLTGGDLGQPSQGEP